MKTFIQICATILLLSLIILALNLKQTKPVNITTKELIGTCITPTESIDIIIITVDEFIEVYNSINTTNQVLLIQGDVTLALQAIRNSKAIVDSIFMTDWEIPKLPKSIQPF